MQNNVNDEFEHERGPLSNVNDYPNESNDNEFDPT